MLAYEIVQMIWSSVIEIWVDQRCFPLFAAGGFAAKQLLASESFRTRPCFETGAAASYLQQYGDELEKVN